MTTTLIDRYVITALRRVPEQQRADIDRELRASIDDAVDARVENGEPRDAAIEQALLELGDPDRLADQYAGRRQMLIGPDFYPAWRRLLMMLLTVVLPIVVAVAVVAQIVDDAKIGLVIGTAVTTAITVAVHMAFWVTAVFAVIERTGAVKAAEAVEAVDANKSRWTPADLPEYEPRAQTYSQLAAGVVWPVLLAVALVLQQFTFTAEPVLDPANWSFWWPFLMVVLAAEAAYTVWLYRRGAWSHTVTLVNAVLAVLSWGPVVWLLSQEQFFNPAFVEDLTWKSNLTAVGLIVAVAAAIWDIAEVAIKAERARRGLATPVVH